MCCHRKVIRRAKIQPKTIEKLNTLFSTQIFYPNGLICKA